MKNLFPTSASLRDAQSTDVIRGEGWNEIDIRLSRLLTFFARGRGGPCPIMPARISYPGQGTRRPREDLWYAAIPVKRVPQSAR